MPQIRYWDYLSPVPSAWDNIVNRVLNNAGVYEGLDLDVNSSNQLIATVGFGLQPDGVIWEETTDVEIDFSPTVAQDYTIVAIHENEERPGGAPVTYEALAGIFTTYNDAVILGWVYYPGGGVPVTIDYILKAPKALPNERIIEKQDLAPIVLIPEFPRSYYDIGASGVNTTFTPLEWTTVGTFLMYQKCANSAAAPGAQQIVQHFQFYRDTAPRPISFDFWVNIPAAPLTNLTVQIYGSDQVLVPIISGSPITGTGSWEKKTVVVHRYNGVFDQDEPYTMRLIFNLGIGQEIKLGRIKANFWPYPIL